MAGEHSPRREKHIRPEEFLFRVVKKILSESDMLVSFSVGMLVRACCKSAHWGVLVACYRGNFKVPKTST